MPTPAVVRRRRAIKAGISLLVLALAGAIAGRIYLIRTTRRTPEEVAQTSGQESQILSRVNLERTRAGLPPLALSARLAVVARGHSYDMALRHYLSHESPEGIGPAQRLAGEGINCQAAAENIYAGDYRGLSELPERAVAAWMHSPEHRAAILSGRFLTTGVGVAHSADGTFYVTQDFVR
ncbi:MAG TPA: CAP domain-containing protein [Candidatus Binataceae bacterium]|nr:CAP domain-containing protein [Candidatus Binataceae bacterium]